MYWTPWTITRPWLPRVFLGTDEWHNHSLAILTPLGGFIFFYKRGPLKFDGSEGHADLAAFKDSCPDCAEVWADILADVSAMKARLSHG